MSVTPRAMKGAALLMETPIRRDSRRQRTREGSEEEKGTLFSPSRLCFVTSHSILRNTRGKDGPDRRLMRREDTVTVGCLPLCLFPWPMVARACHPTSQESNILKHGKIATAKVAKVDALQRKERCGKTERLHIQAATFYQRMNVTEKDAEDSGGNQ